MVPSLMALSINFWVAAYDFSMSAHCARGIFQSATYVYKAGFSFTSEVCAPACPAQTADIPSAHRPVRTFHIFPFMVLSSSVNYQGLLWVFLANGKCTGRSWN